MKKEDISILFKGWSIIMSIALFIATSAVAHYRIGLLEKRELPPLWLKIEVERLGVKVRELESKIEGK